MSGHRPKILFFSTQQMPPFWGGSEKFWYEVVSDQRVRKLFDCSVLLSDSPVTRTYGGVLQMLGVAVGYDSDNPPSILQRVGRRLTRVVLGKSPPQCDHPWLIEAIDRCRPALVWFNLATAGNATQLEHASEVCRKRGVPYWLIVQHAWEQFFFRDDKVIEQFAKVVEGARRVVCVAKRNRAAVERMVGRRLRNVWMTVNAVSGDFIERAAVVAKDRPVRVHGPARLLNLARFDPICKGQHILFEILSDPTWRHREWVLVLQGGGGVGSLLKRQIAFYGLDPKRVELREHTSDVLSVIAESDLLVIPSLSEGMPFALVESLACGRPAVGTPVGAIPELIIPGETGWLARSIEVADVAEALGHAWAERPCWSVYGENGRELVAAAYNQDRTFADLIGCIQEDIGT